MNFSKYSLIVLYLNSLVLETLMVKPHPEFAVVFSILLAKCFVQANKKKFSYFSGLIFLGFQCYSSISDLVQ